VNTEGPFAVLSATVYPVGRASKSVGLMLTLDRPVGQHVAIPEDCELLFDGEAINGVDDLARLVRAHGGVTVELQTDPAAYNAVTGASFQSGD
jgi:hypothetical protein